MLFSSFGGGMLTGAEIERQISKGNIIIDPLDLNCINPNSYNLKLHPELLVYSRNSDRSNVLPISETYKESEEDIIKRTYATISNIKHIGDKSIINSLDLHPLDMNSKNETISFEIPEEGYVLQPGVLYIGRTVERTWTDKFIPMINGRSSGGRLGISVHITAGFGDIGFDGTWTLEITAVEPVRIYPNVEIAQVCYFKPVGKIGKLYRGRYFGQEHPTASRFYKPKEY